jgi:flagellar basal body-associated protein FliL
MAENDNFEFGGEDSKFMRVLLIIVTVLLIFAGPTYVPYVLSGILNVSSVVATITGFALFIVGLFLMLFLIRKKIIS